MPALTPTPITNYPPQQNFQFSAEAQIPVSGEPGSGTTSATMGVWRQGMNIEYWRVPVGGPSSVQYSLADMTYDPRIQATMLQVRWTAWVSVQKYEGVHWLGDNYTVNQQFGVEAVSADSYGNTYGSITDASTLGPNGTILTQREYYNRMPWADVSAYWQYHLGTSSMEGCNVAFGNFTFSGGPNSWHAGRVDWLNAVGQHGYLGRFDKTLAAWNEEGTMTPWQGSQSDQLVPIWQPALYWLQGPYITTQESITQLINMIETIGIRISSDHHNLQKFYRIPAYMAHDGGDAGMNFRTDGRFYNPDTNSWEPKGASLGMYDAGFHDYSNFY